jgi:hypothetical protein
MIATLNGSMVHIPYPYHSDPQLRGSPAGAYYHRQLKELISEFGVKVIARCVCVVEFFSYHSRNYRDLAKIPSQDYSLHLVREAMARSACIVIARSKRALLGAIPELEKYPRIDVKNPQSGVLSRGNAVQFEKIREAIAQSESIRTSSEQS